MVYGRRPVRHRVGAGVVAVNRRKFIVGTFGAAVSVAIPAIDPDESQFEWVEYGTTVVEFPSDVVPDGKVLELIVARIANAQRVMREQLEEVWLCQGD